MQLFRFSSQTYHLKVKGDGKLTYHLGADYFEDPDGTFVSQPKKYIDKLADTYKRLFNEDPPKGYNFEDPDGTLLANLRNTLIS